MATVDPVTLLGQVRRRALKPPDRVTIDEWCDRYRQVLPPSATPGRWRTSTVPYLRQPMRDFTDPTCRGIVLMFAPQTGKTECWLNCLAYTIDVEPYPSLVVMDTIHNARDFSQDRLLPTLRACPRLERHLSPKAWETKRQMIAFDTMTLFMTGSNSPGNLASKPVGRLFIDERDKFPAVSRRRGTTESGAAELARKRLTQYGTLAKFIETCSPTIEFHGIHLEYSRSSACTYMVPCPLCGEYQKLVLGTEGKGGLRWEGGTGRDLSERAHAEHVARVRRSTVYRCGHCEGDIFDRDKGWMLQHGIWLAQGQSIEGVCRRSAGGGPPATPREDKGARDPGFHPGQGPGARSAGSRRNPGPGTPPGGGPKPETRNPKPDAVRIIGSPTTTEVRGYALSQLYAPWVSFGDVAAGFVSLRGEINQDFVNGVLGEPWAQAGDHGSEADLIEIASMQARAAEEIGLGDEEARAHVFKRGEVPPGALVLLGAADVQKDGLFCLIMGFGAGEARWLIDWSFIPCPEIPGADDASEAKLMGRAGGWRRVVEHWQKAWPRTRTGEAVDVSYWALDTGFRTGECYRIAKALGNVIVPMKGQENQAAPMLFSEVDLDPERSKQLSAKRKGAAGRSGSRGVASEFKLELVSIKPNHWRDEAFKRMHRRMGAYGHWRYPIDFLSEGGGEVMRQWTSEERVIETRRGRPVFIWRKRAGRSQNHWWDCAVMLEALADQVGANRLGEDGVEVAEEQQVGEGGGLRRAELRVR